MENIIKNLNLGKKEEINLYTKFYMTVLMLQQEGEQRLENTNKLLKEFGISIKKASQIKLAFLDSKVLFDRLSYAKEHNMLLDIIKDPLLLMEKNRFTNKTKEIKESFEKVSEEPVQEVSNNLSALQAKGLDEVTYEIYESAATYLSQLLHLLNDRVNMDLEAVNDNIIKLVTNNYDDFEKILFLAIINTDNYSTEELSIIKDSINEVVSFGKEEKKRVA